MKENMDNYMSLAQYAKQRGLNRSTVYRKCIAGHMPEAICIAGRWYIPKDAPYIDARVKSGAYIGFRRRNEIPLEEYKKTHKDQ